MLIIVLFRFKDDPQLTWSAVDVADAIHSIVSQQSIATVCRSRHQHHHHHHHSHSLSIILTPFRSSPSMSTVCPGTATTWLPTTALGACICQRYVNYWCPRLEFYCGFLACTKMMMMIRYRLLYSRPDSNGLHHNVISRKWWWHSIDTWVVIIIIIIIIITVVITVIISIIIFGDLSSFDNIQCRCWCWKLPA